MNFLITKFKIFESIQFDLDIGDYVYLKDTGIWSIYSGIIGKIVSKSLCNDFGELITKYKILMDSRNFAVVYKEDIKILAKSKEELEMLLSKQKYNL